jgi:biofilm PGA synthesis N-glycosyltransferase PgaC
VSVPTIFWISICVPMYAYIGYPLVLTSLALAIRRPIKKQPITPMVSLLVPAYNEANVIAHKIRNLMMLDYPSDRIEIVIASDGSSDQTVEIARSLAGGTRIRILAFPKNRGKLATQNASIAELRGELIVLSDASAMLQPDSIRRLAENFADPRVGAASGLYRIVKANQANIGASEAIYWRYETFLKMQESQLASTLGAHGALYAIRKELYPYPPQGTINDDYVIPLSVLRKGFRSVYEPSAVAYEEAQEMTGFGRRVRIMVGNIQQLREIRGLLYPFRPVELFFFLSHKLCRLLVPFAMLVTLVTNALLLDSPLCAAIFCAQLIFYFLVACGATWQLRPKLLMLPYYFSMINLAAFFGFYHVLMRRRGLAWK